jgi:predicted amidophosphoribosyltransferase
MKGIKFICTKCGYESKNPGLCPDCQVALVASCSACGNPVVGEHIKPPEG